MKSNLVFSCLWFLPLEPLSKRILWTGCSESWNPRSWNWFENSCLCFSGNTFCSRCFESSRSWDQLKKSATKKIVFERFWRRCPEILRSWYHSIINHNPCLSESDRSLENYGSQVWNLRRWCRLMNSPNNLICCFLKKAFSWKVSIYGS